VGVGVEGRPDVGVPEQLLDEFGMYSLREKEARTGVFEVMKGNSR
jgi:hypothetical protein